MAWERKVFGRAEKQVLSEDKKEKYEKDDEGTRAHHPHHSEVELPAIQYPLPPFFAAPSSIIIIFLDSLTQFIPKPFENFDEHK